MSKFKKLISALAATAVTATMFASVSFAAIPSDAVGTEIEKQATVLGALEIMVGDAGTGTFRPQDPIIRSEVAKVGVALLGLSQVADSSSDVSFYPDVDASHWANGFINVATAQKLVIGDDTGTFRPDDQIKYSEAVAILVRALGYEPQAKTKGGYPAGYITTASTIGLTKGVPGSAEKLISRGDVAKLAYNALTINLMEQTGFGTNVDYDVTDKTLLEDKLDTALVSGKVEAVGSSSLDGSSELEKDEIQIDGKVYNTGYADVRNLLGFSVDAYVSQKSNRKNTLIAAVPSDGQNTVLSVGAENIDKIVTGSSSMTLHYFEDADNHNKSAKATIQADAHIIYNGKSADTEKFAPIESGSIVLLDSDNDKKFDVVFVNETQNYVIDEVFTNTNKITDKYNLPALELDTKDDSKTVVIEKDNEYVGVDSLEEWDVVTLTKSEDEELIYATVIRNSFQGKVSEKDSGYVYIDGKKYKTASNYTEGLSLGDEGTFYLDIEGKIAAFNRKNSKNANYAYLIKAAMLGGMDKTLNLKVFTMDGKTELLSTASKLRVDSSSGLTPEEALAKIGSGDRLITFETNSKGEVNKIYTAKASDTIDEDSFVMNFEENDVVYRASSSKLISSKASVTVGADTVIFDIPEGGNESDYAIRNKSVFSDGGLYNIKVFDISENYKAGVIIVTNSVAKVDEASPIAVIKSITTVKNDDGDTVHKIYALSENKEIVLTSKDEKTFVKENGSLLKEGDVIQFRTAVSGEVDTMSVLFDISEKDSEFKKDISGDLTTIYGRITKKFADSVNVQVSDSRHENFDIENASVFVYDSSVKKNKVSIGDKSDLQTYENDGGKVFMKIYKDTVTEIVVIK
ncbi:MAG: S-layer homology domain-containing protein [Clostridia bacterium]|nr:S-layer homology domain-containing protein [Clostridia bacterium]